MSSKKKLLIIREMYVRFQQDEIAALSAQVTYYLILAFFPFLIFFVTLASYTNIASIESLSLLAAVLPDTVYTLVMDVIRNVMETRSRALLSFGMLATLWSASTGALAFMHGINKAYKLKETRPFWKVRLISIFFIIAFVIIIIFSLLLVIFGEYITRYLFNLVGIHSSYKGLWDTIRFLFTLVATLMVFILFYFYTPNCRVYYRDILPGAVLSTLGWLALSIGFAFYVNNFGNFSKTYGSIGAIIVLLLWLYWSSMIVLTSGELNAVLLEVKHKTMCKKDRQNYNRQKNSRATD